MGGSRCQVDAQSRFAAVASYALRLIRLLADICQQGLREADGRRKVAATEVEAESVAAVLSGEGESTFFGVRSPEFLGRMHEQLDELVSARDQMGQLLQLAMEIGSDLELDAALHRIITAAMRTTGARYGALGVWASDDTLSSFVHSGMDAETVRRVGHLPAGKGVLGLLQHRAEPLRLEDLTAQNSTAADKRDRLPARTIRSRWSRAVATE